ncbi:Hypothetical predicted protein [Mytilus galloprovincialis]|uniref:SEA domain-containing protein n=1 Tax=Mytilus galloprovincialis TaxID=29158 RepID=A0A8B6EIL7_MYTGA|nr:Hypothetical predicted protein [Mytilus galloprovincialis]
MLKNLQNETIVINVINSLSVSVPTTTYTPVSGELKVEVILTINVTPHDEINNENSAYYQELFNATFIVLTNYYSNSAATKDNFIKIVVYRMSKGSLVVNHAVIMNSTSTTGQNQVAAATNNLVNGGATVTIGFVTAGATKADIYAPGGNATVTTSTTICGTFNTLNTCPTGQECSIDGNGVPYCAPIESTVSVPTTTYTPVSATVTTSTTICGTFNTLNTCPTGQECSIAGNGVPYCAPLKSTGKF